MLNLIPSSKKPQKKSLFSELMNKGENQEICTQSENQINIIEEHTNESKISG